jgi:hypothetical protein
MDVHGTELALSDEIFHRNRIVNWMESTVERRSAAMSIHNGGRVS